MMGKIHIQEITASTVGENEVEIVERKGLGHPDTICDLVMEQISQALSRAYTQSFGRILHHNCDKGLMVGGQVELRYGGGRVIEPMRLVIGDRATLVKEFDVAEIAVETAKDWFRRNLPEIDVSRHLAWQVELKGGSAELTDIFRAGSVIAQANDTSAAVGYAPLSETERLVLHAERFLNGEEFKKQYPDSGKDVKVMGIRTRDQLDVTVALPLLDKFVVDEAAYFARKEEMRLTLFSYLQSRLENVRTLNVSMNTLDRRGAGLSGIYLSVLGTSAEDADSGEVGRGNQVNGIIALNRPRGSEAAAGKNPVSHVGKIYSVLTHVLAHRIYHEVPGLREVVVWLCSRIGDPVDSPRMASVQVKLANASSMAEVKDPIGCIVERELQRMPVFCSELAAGKYSIC
jgi:S-adenosylmethionine synthetase